jgi:hypothetical protein
VNNFHVRRKASRRGVQPLMDLERHVGVEVSSTLKKEVDVFVARAYFF